MNDGTTKATPVARPVRVHAGEVTLEAHLAVPDDAYGVVLFAHESGMSRFSSQALTVRRHLQQQGLATLLVDLLTPEEEDVDRRTHHLRFDIPTLAQRMAGAARWLRTHEPTRGLAVGAFGASTVGGAALLAAADHPDAIQAVVSCGGRPDLAGEALARLEIPVLLIVGGRDVQGREMNRNAMAQMEHAEVKLDVVPGAIHLFEEEVALEEVAHRTAEWFSAHLGDHGESSALAPRETQKPEAQRESEVYARPADVARLISEHAEPFGTVNDANLDALLDRIGDARVVCLGEATHGTHEFYALRARITQALVERKGFRIIAAEADWPDAERVDAYVRHREPREQGWEAFARFPTWMWRNEEVAALVEWLRTWNAQREARDRAGFFGLDLYSLYTSLYEVLDYLEDRDPELAEEARARYSCLTPFSEDPALYGRAVVSERYRDCEDEAVAMLQDLLRQRLRLTAGEADGGETHKAFPFFDAAQNASVVRDAERYYREMFYGNVSTWNLRDTHMMRTLQALLRFFGGDTGNDAKAVVWAHNSHLGDAAATYQAQRGEINLGHLCRQAYGDDAYLIGFGTHTGTVFAADDWGAEGHVKRVRPSHPESYEWLGHESGVANFFLPLRRADRRLLHELEQARLERAIGVIYRPRTELQSHYFPASLPHQFDEWIWIDETQAVTPLGPSHAPDLPHTHPLRLLVD